MRTLAHLGTREEASAVGTFAAAATQHLARPAGPAHPEDHLTRANAGRVLGVAQLASAVGLDATLALGDAHAASRIAAVGAFTAPVVSAEFPARRATRLTRTLITGAARWNARAARSVAALLTGSTHRVTALLPRRVVRVPRVAGIAPATAARLASQQDTAFPGLGADPTAVVTTDFACAAASVTALLSLGGIGLIRAEGNVASAIAARERQQREASKQATPKRRLAFPRESNRSQSIGPSEHVFRLHIA